MHTKKLRRPLAAAATAAALLVPGAGAAQARSISRVPASCAGATAAYGIFMEQGSPVTLGFGANTAGRWHVTITDRTTRFVDYTVDFGAAWSASTDGKLPRGAHHVTVNAENVGTSETRAAAISFDD